MGGIDPGRGSLPTSEDIKKGLKRPKWGWGLRAFQAGVIGTTPAILEQMKEQALGYVSVNATETATNAVSLIQSVHGLTIAMALVFMLSTLLHIRRKTPHALLCLLACAATFVGASLTVSAETDDVWAARVRAEPGPCQAYFQSRKQLGNDGATESFMMGACMAHDDIKKESVK